MGGSNHGTACPRFVHDPQKFQHRVSEKDAAIGSFLSRVGIGGTFREAKRNEGINFGRTNTGTHEAMI
jgi:hypothetical protein